MKINQKSTFWLFLIDEDPPPSPMKLGLGLRLVLGAWAGSILHVDLISNDLVRSSKGYSKTLINNIIL